MSDLVNKDRKVVTEDVIKTFLDGHDPMERIVGLDYEYKEDKIKIFYRDEYDNKHVAVDYFHPFCWATKAACRRLCDGDKVRLLGLMKEYGIYCRGLDTRNNDGVPQEIFEEGYTVLFYTVNAMSYSRFGEFFRRAGNPLYAKRDKFGNVPKGLSHQYLVVTPQEQYMIYTGKRFFKGYADYDEILRLAFDLETQGLDPYRHRIEELGARFNRPFRIGNEMITFEQTFSVVGSTPEELKRSELNVIDLMFKIISAYRPDVVTAHNGEAFDWHFIEVRCKMNGTTIEEMSAPYFGGKPIYKSEKESILKLGGEVETYHQTVVPYTIVTDSLHAVRRAQALDSNMEKADLKYVTKYSKIVKPNRVYVPGNKITSTRNDLEEHYAFNDVNGDWYRVTPSKPLKSGYELKSGKYIVERYLLDDLWECDKVEHRYNTPNFLICKMLPIPFQKCCTMGTAGQWKSLMLAWSFENGLAIPQFGNKEKFTGGLSRLLTVGFVDRVAKFDYNSLYPSIILTWGISDNKDLMGSMLHFLKYVLTQREKYKGLKKEAGGRKKKLKKTLAKFEGPDAEKARLKDELRIAEEEESANDKKQLPLKILGNSFFGSYGAPDVFNWASIVCGERTTCTGRMSLRLMIYHFTNLGYRPIVGDSFTGDTPLFIRYDDTGMVDIVPIEDLIDAGRSKTDALGREYDYTFKPYRVLCRSGWVRPEYIYRHRTGKPVCKVRDTDMSLTVEVTEDHSLFNSDREKIKPGEIGEGTKLEYYEGAVEGKDIGPLSKEDYDGVMKKWADDLVLKGVENSRVPVEILNAPESVRKGARFFMMNLLYEENIEKWSKTLMAGLDYIKR